jgi:protein-S-isoprenylcysteine O-methyltransferase Ste14
MSPIIAIYLVWATWLVTWLAASLWSSQSLKRAGIAQELLYRALMFVGVVLLFSFYSNHYDIQYRFWDVPRGAVAWVLPAVVAVGLSFAWWARTHVGHLRSSSVTRKTERRIVDTGPYAAVRHPIYTGIMLAAFATAVAHGTPSSFLGAAIMTVAWIVKARLEERFLRAELGSEVYDAYAKRVPMLVPFLRRAAPNKANNG